MTSVLLLAHRLSPHFSPASKHNRPFREALVLVVAPRTALLPQPENEGEKLEPIES